jgi:hypothetical protein
MVAGKLDMTVEQARSRIRNRFGQNGAKSRKAKHVRQPRKPGEGWQIPEAVSANKPPRYFRQAGRWLIIGDLHIPYHDEEAIGVCLDFAKLQKCQHLYINGDFLDCYKASSFEQDPSARDVWQELAAARPFLQRLGTQFDGKAFKCGNHEARLTRYTRERAPQIAMIDDCKLPSLLRLAEYGFEYVEDRQLAFIGKLPVWHGHELPKGLAPAVNPARGLHLRVGDTCVMSHSHKTSTHTEGTGIHRREMVYWSIGCLCSRNAAYDPANKWNHGFAIVDVTDAGDYEFANYRIKDGVVRRA